MRTSSLIRWALLLASLGLGCTVSDPVEPAFTPNIDPGRWAPTSLEESAIGNDVWISTKTSADGE